MGWDAAGLATEEVNSNFVISGALVCCADELLELRPCSGVC